MTKIPEKPEVVFEEFAADYQEIFSGDLLSVILYGSAARGEYVYKKSDLNFLIVLTDRGLSNLPKTLPLVEKWRKRAVAIPLFLNEAYLTTSLDSFPIEFFNITAHYKLVYGHDLIKGLTIQRSDLRRECERELKGKLLHLRQAYFITRGKRKELHKLFAVSFKSFFPLLPVILELIGVPVPDKRKEMMEIIIQKCQLQGTVFKQLWEIMEQKKVLPEDETVLFWQRYVDQIQQLGIFVDRLE